MSSKNDNTAIEPTVLTIAQLARRWKCSRQVIYLAINRGELAVFKIGERSMRVRLEEVERYERASLKRGA